MARAQKHDRRGITVLEVLVAIVLCLCALGFILMLINRHRESAQRVQCQLNLKVVGEAIRAYHDGSSADKALKRLPPSRIADSYATWSVLIAPYLAKENALTAWDKQTSYFAQSDDVRQTRILVYFCPTRKRADTLSSAGDLARDGKQIPGGLGDYACVAADNAADWTSPKANGALVSADDVLRDGDRIVQWRSATSLASLTRGEAQTLIVGEKHVPIDRMGDAAVGDGSFYNGQHAASYSRIAGPGFPIAPGVTAPFNKNFGSYHNGVCQFLNADTSVRTLRVDINEEILGKLARRGE